MFWEMRGASDCEIVFKKSIMKLTNRRRENDMNKQQMIFKMKQLAHNQQTLETLFKDKEDDQRAEIAHTKRVMYENFAELLESWLDQDEAEPA
jgi:hypothetical protein